jgi:hypothetical protein
MSDPTSLVYFLRNRLMMAETCCELINKQTCCLYDSKLFIPVVILPYYGSKLLNIATARELLTNVSQIEFLQELSAGLCDDAKSQIER